ncbi:uncharacterized protein LTR77_001129 [Saxophila tyrrhenica]|uniref:Velvet domain-containing protein n=1 Tax=Saxophila tyrrhenica TaxID=1690608 RepID=A0AAV9PP54_9PEZI|nr:hypothetical protein LTR77_001129 [Saxophila tyrrhenica]
MVALLVEAEQSRGHDGIDGFRPVRPNPLVGASTSSLHRLKDVDNKDGGFFVFGDISCRREGRFRLQFALFELRPDGSEFLNYAMSNPFKVVPFKEFRGMKESTHLSRTFSDQGVRLRLRKEPRAIGAKRSWTGTEMGPTTSPPSRDPMGMHHERNDYGYEMGSMKRQRTDSDFTPHSYSQQPYAGGPVNPTPSYFETGGINMDNNGWPIHNNYQASLTHNQHMAQPSPAQPVAQRSYAHMSYPPTLDTTTGQDYSVNTTSALNLSTTLGDVYAGQRNQTYSSRPSGGSFDQAHGLRTPTSASDSSNGYANQRSAVQSNPQDVRISIEQMTPMAQNLAQSQGISSVTPSYGMPPNPLNSSAQSYTTAADTIDSAYGQTMPQSGLKYELDDYGSTTNPYFDTVPTRDTYASAGGSLSDTNLPLGGSMLNRSYAPAHAQQQPQQQQQQQQSSEGSMPSQDLAGYKASVQAYPTPNQTSPLG